MTRITLQKIPNGPPSHMVTLVLSAALALSGCRHTHSHSEREDLAHLAGMRAEIEALAGTPACSDSGDCRYIGFGSKPCGGPWGFLVYSIATVDTTVLLAKVMEYNEFEEVLNHRYGYSSDCSVPAEPRLDCADGVCVDLHGSR